MRIKRESAIVGPSVRDFGAEFTRARARRSRLSRRGK